MVRRLICPSTLTSTDKVHAQTVALVAFFLAVSVSGCLESQSGDQGTDTDRVVGLAFLPSYTTSRTVTEELEGVVHRLASERFRGSPDTVLGRIHAFGETAENDDRASDRFLLITFDDRETGDPSVTVLYVIELSRDPGPYVSAGYRIAREPRQEFRVFTVEDLDGDDKPDLVYCLIGDGNQEPQLTAVSHRDGTWKPIQQRLFDPQQCPKPVY